MAIAKMEKITFISEKANQQEVLKVFQSFQGVEFFAVEEISLDNSLSINSDLYKDELEKIEKAQNIISTWYKGSFIGDLRKGRNTLTLDKLDKIVETGKWRGLCTDILESYKSLELNRKQRSEMISLSETWGKWRGLTTSLDQLKALTTVIASVGTIPTIQKADFISSVEGQEENVYYEFLFEDDKNCGLFLVIKKEKWESAIEILKPFEITEIQYPYEKPPLEMLEIWKRKEEDLVQEENILLDKLTTLSLEKETLDLADEYYNNLIIRTEAAEQISASKTAFLINGWIVSDEKENLKNYLSENIETEFYLNFSEVGEKETKDVPIQLKNKKINTAFEDLTEMYSLPKYNEIDPTPFLAPFYLVFFGMMVADIGYGISLWILTFLAGKLFNLDKPMAKNVSFFHYLSYPIVFWGILYGSFFGLSLPFQLFSPTTDIIPILILSLILGFIQMVAGLAIGTYLSIKNKDIIGAIGGGGSWIGLLMGIALILVSQIFEGVQWLFYPSIVLCGITSILIIVTPILKNKKAPVKGFLKGLYEIYGISGYVGDLVSYSRLMALGVAGGSIAVAFNTIIASLPLGARLTVGILLSIALQGLNLFLSLLSAYVHGIRLQYVEFFGKFYEGGGRKFAPFKTIEKHVYIAKNKNIKN